LVRVNVARAVEEAQSKAWSLGYNAGRAAGVEGEREACAKVAAGLTCGDDDCRAGDSIAYRIRARQRAGGYDPEVGYFDAWKGSD